MSNTSEKSSGQIEHVNRPYSFEAYDTTWPSLFEEYAKEITEIFGDTALSIEHVGSTSIPDMPSKPQIDILMTCQDLPVIPAYYNKVIAYGYTPRGDYTNEGEEYFTKENQEGVRLVSLHVLPEGHHWATELINFRDFLREYPAKAAEYADIKNDAHRLYPDDYTNYYKYKLATVHKLMKEAAEWRGLTYEIPE